MVDCCLSSNNGEKADRSIDCANFEGLKRMACVCILLRLLLSIGAQYVYRHKPCVRSFVIAVVDSADGQTFLAQSPYVFYEGEKCKVVGTIHNSNDS
jgi:hypothetical protein